MNATSQSGGGGRAARAERRRRHVRVCNGGEIDTVCTAPRGHAAARLLDVSMGGAALLAPVRLGEVGDRMQLRVRLDEHDEWMTVECELRHLTGGDDTPGGRWLHGVRFDHRSPRIWALLTDYIEIGTRIPTMAPRGPLNES